MGIQEMQVQEVRKWAVERAIDSVTKHVPAGRRAKEIVDHAKVLEAYVLGKEEPE